MSNNDLETEGIELQVEVGLHEQCMKEREGYYSGVRPNHWIPGRSYCFIGQLDFEGCELLKPGEKCKATLRGIIASQDKEKFVKGFAWHIAEANRIVGYATVL